tara:strand:+ start:364 stop:510 length:147 start_codon:yes stop_codon:yes gene_type:complete
MNGSSGTTGFLSAVASFLISNLGVWCWTALYQRLSIVDLTSVYFYYSL